MVAVYTRLSSAFPIQPYVQTYTQIQRHTHKYTHIHPCTYIHARAQKRTHTHKHIHVHIYTHVRKNVHTHPYTHTHTYCTYTTEASIPDDSEDGTAGITLNVNVTSASSLLPEKNEHEYECLWRSRVVSFSSDVDGHQPSICVHLYCECGCVCTCMHI